MDSEAQHGIYDSNAPLAWVHDIMEDVDAGRESMTPAEREEEERRILTPLTTGSQPKVIEPIHDAALHILAYTQVIGGLASGLPMQAATQAAGTNTRWLMAWITTQPDALTLMAAMNHALADGAECKVNELYERFLGRIDDRLVRNVSMADLEVAAIRRYDSLIARYRSAADANLKAAVKQQWRCPPKVAAF